MTDNEAHVHPPLRADKLHDGERYMLLHHAETV